MIGFVIVAACMGFILSLRYCPPRKHPIFAIVLAQFAVYCFVAPWINYFGDRLQRTELGAWYVYLQLLCLFLLLPLMVATYCLLTRKLASMTGSMCVAVHSRQSTIFVWFCIIGSFTYLGILSQSGLLFRRVGHGELAYQYLNLPTLVFVSIRVFDNLLLPLIVVSFLTYWFGRDSRKRRWSLLAFLSVLSVQLCVSALNSRFQLAIAICLVWAIWSLCNSQTRASVGSTTWRAIFAACFVLSGFNFTLNFRDDWTGDVFASFKWSQLVTMNSGLLNDEGLQDFAERLDGIDLTAQMGPQLAARGYSYGASWRPGFISVVGYIWDPHAVREIKAQLATTPKYTLMYEYAGINMPDYPSCIITDAYGNFGPTGMVLAGILLGAVCAAAHRFLSMPPSKTAMLIGVIAVQMASMFEGSLLDLCSVGWIRAIPTFLVLYFMAPVMPAPNPSSSRSTSVPRPLRGSHVRSHQRLRAGL